MYEKYAMKKLLLTLMLAVVSSSAIGEWVEVGSNEFPFPIMSVSR